MRESTRPAPQDGYIPIKEAVNRLKNAGIIDETASFPEQIVRRLVQRSELNGKVPGAKTFGMYIEEKSLVDYIEIQSMSKKQLMEAALKTKTLETALALMTKERDSYKRKYDATAEGKAAKAKEGGKRGRRSAAQIAAAAEQAQETEDQPAE